MPSWSWLLRALVAAFVLALGLTGCAAFRSYDAELDTTLGYAFSGNVDGAIKTLESHNRLPDRDLLYYFELGMLQRLGNRYQDSQKTWKAANTRISVSKDGSASSMTLVGGGGSVRRSVASTTMPSVPSEPIISWRRS